MILPNIEYIITVFIEDLFYFNTYIDHLPNNLHLLPQIKVRYPGGIFKILRRAYDKISAPYLQDLSRPCSEHLLDQERDKDLVIFEKIRHKIYTFPARFRVPEDVIFKYL